MSVYVDISESNCGICKHLSILFYLAPFIINRTKKSFILNIWFVMGTKYGTAPTDEILKDGMVHGFERIV